MRRILTAIDYRVPARLRFLQRLDALVLHPISGPLLLAVVLFLMFQAVFSWAKWPMDAVQSGVAQLGSWLGTHMTDGPLRHLLVDGVIAGAGSVLVFLPQILILFAFILALEDSGYLPRAAYLLDRLMGKVGLSGRAFIPLLSSFACAIPGIMATRTIPAARDRLMTIMIAPLMTCSARLPVYTLLIGAFIPRRTVGPFNLQGLTLFALYLVGVGGAMAVAFGIKRLFMRGDYHPLLLELPEYKWPNLRNLVLGLWERARIFLGRVGSVLLTLMVVLWFLASFPAAPVGATDPAISYSFAGRLGHAMMHVFAPIGFNWQICVALVPGLAGARGRRRRPGHGLFDVGGGPERRRRPAAHSVARLDRCDRPVAARLVHFCPAMPVDSGGGAARDQHLALSFTDGRLSVRAGVSHLIHHLSRGVSAGAGLNAAAMECGRSADRFQRDLQPVAAARGCGSAYGCWIGCCRWRSWRTSVGRVV